MAKHPLVEEYLLKPAQKLLEDLRDFEAVQGKSNAVPFFIGFDEVSTISPTALLTSNRPIQEQFPGLLICYCGLDE